jgi:hypothetical protein
VGGRISLSGFWFFFKKEQIEKKIINQKKKTSIIVDRYPLDKSLIINVCRMKA